MEKEQYRRRLGTWAAVCGIMSAAFYALHDIIGGLNYPGYDRMRQAVSDLTAVDAPSFVIAGGSLRDGRRGLGLLAIVALVCMAFGAAGSGALPQSVFGLVERFSTYSAVIFTGVLGVYGARRFS